MPFARRLQLQGQPRNRGKAPHRIPISAPRRGTGTIERIGTADPASAVSDFAHRANKHGARSNIPSDGRFSQGAINIVSEASNDVAGGDIKHALACDTLHHGDPYENRTRVFAVRGRRPNR